MAKKLRTLTREEILRPAAPGRMTAGEWEKTSSGILSQIGAVRVFLADTKLADELSGNQTDVLEFFRATDAVIRHHKAGRWIDAMAAMFRAGEMYASMFYRIPAELHIEAMIPFRDANEKRQLTVDELQDHLASWDAQIKASGIRSKSRAMVDLGIPRSTYYAYREKLRRAKKAGK